MDSGLLCGGNVFYLEGFFTTSLGKPGKILVLQRVWELRGAMGAVCNPPFGFWGGFGFSFVVKALC